MKKLLLMTLVLSAGFACRNSEVERQEDGLALEYTSGTVVVNKSLNEVVVSADESTQTFTLNKAAFDKQPRVGEVILVPGEIMHKVRAIRSSGNYYEVEMEPAALTEVVKNGTFAFEVEPQWGDASSLRIDGREMLAKGGRLSASPIEFKMNVSGVEYNILIEPRMQGDKINACTFRFRLSKGGSTAFEVAGTATLPKQKTLIYIEDGKLKEFRSENEEMNADFEVTTYTAGGESGEHRFALPTVAMSFPIRLLPSPIGMVPNPIPMSVDVGVQFTSDMTVPDPMSSASAVSRVSYSAAGGFEYKGTDVGTSGNLSKAEIVDGRFDAAAGFGMPVDLQFGVAFPRVALSIVGQEVLFLRAGYTTGTSLEWGPLCKRGYSKVVLEGGYELKALGQTISSAKSIREMRKDVSSGCD